MFNYALYLQSDNKRVYKPKKDHLGLSNLFHITDFDESNFKTECIFLVFLWHSWNKFIRVDCSPHSNELQGIVYIKFWLTLKIVALFNVDIYLEISQQEQWRQQELKQLVTTPRHIFSSVSSYETEHIKENDRSLLDIKI